METLGSLIDKLIVVKLKEFHNQDWNVEQSLSVQQQKLLYEITDYLADVSRGKIRWEDITFRSNKIHTGTAMPDLDFQNMAILIAILSRANCEIWHLQEKLYNFAAIPAEDKDAVVEAIAIENLKRTKCIEGIDMKLQDLMRK